MHSEFSHASKRRCQLRVYDKLNQEGLGCLGLNSVAVWAGVVVVVVVVVVVFVVCWCKRYPQVLVLLITN